MKNELVIKNQKVSFSVHALDRYRTRVKQGLGRQKALEDLLKLGDIATIDNAPKWAEDSRDDLLATTIDTWLFFGPDIAFPVINNIAITCISKGSISEESRNKRNKKRVEEEASRKRYRTTKSYPRMKLPS